MRPTSPGGEILARFRKFGSETLWGKKNPIFVGGEKVGRRCQPPERRFWRLNLAKNFIIWWRDIITDWEALPWRPKSVIEKLGGEVVGLASLANRGLL